MGAETPQEVEQMVREALAENNRRFAAAVTGGDARAMASLYAADAALLPPNSEALQGRQAIERFWEGGIEMGIRGMELETLQLEQSDGLAYEVGRCTLRFEPEDSTPADVGKYVFVHRLEPDGSWRRVVEIFNWNAPLA